MKKYVTLILVLFIIALVGCGQSGFTLSGTLTLTQASPDGHKAYAKLVTLGAGLAADPLYSGEATFTGSTATYSISGITAGTYTLYAFIDMDDSAGGAPNTGDYVTDTNVVIASDTTQDAPDNAWSQY